MDLDYAFAVQRENDNLFSILNKVSSLVPQKMIASSLTYYSAEESKVTFSDFLRDNLGAAMTVIALILAVILLKA